MTVKTKYLETKMLDLSHQTPRIMLAPGAEVRQRSMVSACFFVFPQRAHVTLSI